MKVLTQLEEKVYNFICDYWNSYGFSPSISDIANGCFISKATAYDYIQRLYDKDYITYVPRIARSLTIKNKRL